MKDMPPEFFLPPEDSRAFWRETRRLVGWCAGFIVVLAIAVALTQDVTVHLG